MNKNKNEQTLHKRKHVVLAFKNSVCEPEHEPNIAKHQTAKKKKRTRTRTRTRTRRFVSVHFGVLVVELKKCECGGIVINYIFPDTFPYKYPYFSPLSNRRLNFFTGSLLVQGVIFANILFQILL